MQRAGLSRLSPDEIDQLVRTGQPRKDLVLKSPINGTILEKKVFEKQVRHPR